MLSASGSTSRTSALSFTTTFPAHWKSCIRSSACAGRDGEPARCTLLYDPADRNLHSFFQGRRYPDEQDLVNAYHTIGLASGGSAAPTFAEIQAISPLSPARMKVCLQLFAHQGIIRSEEGRRYRLCRPNLPRQLIVQAGASYRDRHDRDLDRLGQAVEFAERRTCRWRSLLNYFVSEELAAEGCGHCDCCAA